MQWQRRVSLTSQYSFNVAVRSTLMNLPQPVPRRKQVMRKSEMWEQMRLTTANEEGLHELMGDEQALASVDAAVEEPGAGWGGQRSKTCLVSEVVPYVGLIRSSGRKGKRLFQY